jgi:hypothetical protein
MPNGMCGSAGRWTQLGVRHHWHADSLDDDGVAGGDAAMSRPERRRSSGRQMARATRRRPIAPSTYQRKPRARYRRSDAIPHQPPQLDHHHHTRPDVDANDRLRFGKTQRVCSFLSQGGVPGPCGIREALAATWRECDQRARTSASATSLREPSIHQASGGRMPSETAGCLPHRRDPTSPRRDRSTAPQLPGKSPPNRDCRLDTP